jgi:hypothetical protein
MKIKIYYLEYRGYTYLFHFIIFTLGGLYYITDNSPINIYIPYLVKDCDILDMNIMNSMCEVKEEERIRSYDNKYPGYFGHKLNFDYDKETKLQKEMLEFIRGRYNIIYTLKDIDLDKYDIVYHYGYPGWYPEGYIDKGCCLFLRNLYLLDDTPLKLKKGRYIYITRNFSENLALNNFKKTRQILNETNLYNELYKFGFEYIQFENYNLKEKIDLFQSSEIIVSPHSGGLTFSLFANKNTNIIEIIDPRLLPRCRWYKEICVALDINHSFYLNNVSSDIDNNLIINVDDFMQVIKNTINKILI